MAQPLPSTTWRSSYSQYQKYFFNIVDLYKKRQDLRSFLEILLSLGTITLFVLFALRPTILTISNLLTEINNKETTSAQLDTKIKNLGTAQSLLTQYATPLSLLSTAIPVGPAPNDALRQVQGTAQKDGVNVLGVTSGEVFLTGKGQTANPPDATKLLPPKGNYFTISGSFTGSFEALNSFLTDLENLRRPIYLSNISISTVQSDKGSQTVLTLDGEEVYTKP